MDAPNDFQPKPGKANKTKRCTHNSITYTEACQAGAQKSQVKAKGGKRNATRHQKFQNGPNRSRIEIQFSQKKKTMDTKASRPPPMVGGKWTNAAQAAQPTLKHARVEPQRPTTAHKLQKGAKQSQKKPNGAMDSPWAAMAARGGPWSAKEARRDTKRHHRKPWVPHGHWVQHQGHAPETRNTHTHTTIHPQRQEHITDRSAQGNACQCRNGQTANHESAAGSPKSGHRMATANHVLPDYGHDLPPIERRYVFRFNSYVLDYRRKNQHHRSGFQNFAQTGQLGGRQRSTYAQRVEAPVGANSNSLLDEGRH